MAVDPLASVNQMTSRFNPENNDDKKLKDACQDFEGILIHMMLKSMRKTLAGTDIFGNSMGKDIYQSMYDQEIAERIAQGQNNLGVGDALYRDLSKNRRPYAEDERLIPNQPAVTIEE